MSEHEEPSNFALRLSEKLVDGEHFTLTEADLSSLPAYERAVLKKTAERQGYRGTYDLDTGAVIFAKDWST